MSYFAKKLLPCVECFLGHSLFCIPIMSPFIVKGDPVKVNEISVMPLQVASRKCCHMLKNHDLFKEHQL